MCEETQSEENLKNGRLIRIILRVLSIPFLLAFLYIFLDIIITTISPKMDYANRDLLWIYSLTFSFMTVGIGLLIAGTRRDRLLYCLPIVLIMSVLILAVLVVTFIHFAMY